MKEMNDIEDLFAANLGSEMVTPPSDVKANIDKALFGTKKIGFIRFWPVLLLFLIGTTTGVYFLLKENVNSDKKQVAKLDAYELNKSAEKDEKKILKSELSSSELSSSSVSFEDEKNLSFFSNKVGEENVDNGMQLNAEVDEGAFDSYVDVRDMETTNRRENMSFQSHDIGIENSSDSFSVEGGKTKQDEEDQADSAHIGFAHDVHNSEQVSENRGMEITSKLETKTVNVLESPLNNLETKVYAPKSEDNALRLMSLRLYTGLANGRGPVNYSVQPLMAQKTRVSESNAFNLGAEFGYQISNHFGLSSGLEYASNTSEIIESYTVQDSVVEAEFWEYVYNDPVSQDTIIDSNYIYVYAQFDVDISNASIVKSNAFSIPVYLSFNQRIGNSFDLSVYAGARFSYLSQKFLDKNGFIMNPDLKSFSLSVMMRPELTYNWSNFGIGLYGRVGYDLMNGMRWNTMKRNRFELGGGLVLKYTF